MATELIGCDFCKFLNYEDSDDFFLHEVGSNKCVPGYSYEHLIKNRNIIHFVLSGKGILRVNGKEFHVGAHQAFIIPDGIRCFYQADYDDPWEYIWLHIGGPKFPSILKKAGISPEQPIFTPTACADKIENLLDEIINNYSRQYYCIGTLYQICDYMVNYSSTREEHTVDTSLKYVKNVIAFIQLKYSENIKTSQIAFACGLDRSYLTRIFKDATGYSLQKYLLAYRMKMAVKFLQNESMSIQDIADSVGYVDSFTFSKAFKRHFGKSPSQYREELTHSNN